tara:strand:+ start:379 stop:741 length:363 start_codon:yes stop_codon:yes gene_type:complete
MNSISVSGKFANLKSKTTQSGTKMVTFGVGDQQYYNGEKKTQWLNCIAFGKRAETLEKFSTVLDKITVAGKVEVNTYEGKNGKVTNYNVLVDNYDLVFKRNDEEAEQTNQEKLGTDEIPF